MQQTTTPVLRYPGGKTRAVKTLAPLIPEGVNTVVSPFLGGGSFELYLTGLGKTVYASDKFHQLVVFWQQMLKNPSGLAERLAPYLGTVDKEVFQQFQQKLRNMEGSDEDIATWFYVANRSSFSGTTLSGGYSASAARDRFTKSSVERVRNFRNTLLQVSHEDYLTALQRPADFLFLDPPYLLVDSTLYGNNGDMHDSFDHVEFRDAVQAIDTPALLTYNNSPAIHELWADSRWRIQETSWTYGMNASKKSSEVIITNYDFPVSEDNTV